MHEASSGILSALLCLKPTLQRMTPERMHCQPQGVFAQLLVRVILLKNSPFDQDFLSHPFIPEVMCAHIRAQGDLGEGMREETGALNTQML